jgi:hypothetical protein
MNTAQHIYFDLEEWRFLEKKFAESAARLDPDDMSPKAVIARCRIGLLQFLEQSYGEFGTAKKLPERKKGGRKKLDQDRCLYVWLAVETKKALSANHGQGLAKILEPIFRRNRPWRVLTDVAGGSHIEIKSFKSAERLHRDGQRLLEANPALAKAFAGHLRLAVESARKRATERGSSPQKYPRK